MKHIPITLTSKEKTAMIKNYQTALVTGASHGIGPFIVRALAKEGMNLVLAARSGQELEQVATAADIRATGVHVLTVPTDVTDRDARSALVNTAERTFGAVDVLVNNAGGDLQREFHHYTADDVEALIQLNLTGPIELTRLLLPGMVQRKHGHIVNIFAGRPHELPPYGSLFRLQGWPHRLYPRVAGRLPHSRNQQFSARPRQYRQSWYDNADTRGDEPPYVSHGQSLLVSTRGSSQSSTEEHQA